MSNGTTASLICPACGQAFLTMHHSMDSMTQCPHCAHSALISNFGMQSQVAAVAQVRRRVAHSPPMPEPQVYPPQPQAYPYQQAVPPQFPPSSQPQSYWQPAPAPAHPPQIVRHSLQHSQALMPVGEPPTPPAFTTSAGHHAHSPRHGRAVFFFLGLIALCGVSFWLWWDNTHTVPPVGTAATAQPQAVTRPVQEVRKAEVYIPPAPSRPPIVMPDTAAFSADAKLLVTNLFAATTPEARAACFHEAASHSGEIEALFGPAAAEKIELRQFAQIPGVPFTLPAGQPDVLFKLITNRCPGGALLRLESGPDGKRRIFWPLLMETHEARLATFLKQDKADPAWFYVAMRPSHGLDLPADQRSKYRTFDTQISAANDSHFVACVERDTPLGRFLERESEWGKVYLARLLMQKLDIQAGSPCMLIVDCEGAKER